MSPAFWDASALVPLCALQQRSPVVSRLFNQYEVVVWWATRVEVHSALQRLSRLGQITTEEHQAADQRLENLRRGWAAVQPTKALRQQAEFFLKRYPLKAADALQLAAAWTWCSGTPDQYRFISADIQLSKAARQAGFQTPLD